MRLIDLNLVPHGVIRSTGEHVVRNAFYMPDSNARENQDLYLGYSVNDLSGLEIEKIVPMDEETAKAFEW